jgi:hypothetical protein
MVDFSSLLLWERGKERLTGLHRGEKVPLSLALIPNRLRVIGRQQPGALPERVAQRRRPVVLLEQIGERLGRQLLHGSAGLVRELIQGVPGLAFKFDEATNLGSWFARQLRHRYLRKK